MVVRRVRPLRCERGQSLVLAMVVMSALTISIGALVSFTTGNEHEFGRDRESARAFHVAEAGVNNGLSLIVTNDDNDVQSVGTTLGPYAVSLDGSQGLLHADQVCEDRPQCLQTAGAVASCWLITGTATSPNETITRTIKEIAYWRSVKLGQSHERELRAGHRQPGRCLRRHAWNRQLDDQGRLDQRRLLPVGRYQPCPARGPRGLHLHRRASTREETTPRSVRRPCPTRASTSSAAAPSRAHRRSAATPRTATSGRTVRRPSTRRASRCRSSTPQRPTRRATGTRRNAQPGGSFTFDSDTTANGTTPTTSLMSGASFDCTVNGIDGNPVGHLKWDNSTKQLSISGTVWIDGNLDISNSGTYVKDDVVPGSNGGTIYVNGTVDGSSNATICGPIGSATPSGYGCPGVGPDARNARARRREPERDGNCLRPQRATASWTWRSSSTRATRTPAERP